MYPSTIMTLNISPEMKIGKVNGWDAKEFINKNGEEFARIIGFIDFDNKKFIDWLKNYN